MAKMKLTMTLALVVLCVILAAGFAQAQDDWALVNQDLPTALMPGEAYTGSVEAENTGSTTWDTNYELVSMIGTTAAPTLTDRWGLEAVSVATATGPGGVITFDVSGEAPPWVTLAYNDPYTPTLQPVVATFENGWTMSNGTDLFGADRATEDVTLLPAEFTDVPLSSWAFGAITEAQLAVSGNEDFITQGYSDGTFRPNLGVSRDQMAVFVARAAGFTDSPPAEPTFPDVPDDAFGYAEIEQCVANGVVLGFTDGTYKPALAVTRDQLAVYVQRAAGLTTASYAGGFSDVPDGYWAADSIQACVDASIVQGFSDGTYQPGATVNRATMAVFMIRGLATDVLLGGPAATGVDLDDWGTAGVILPGEADYYGYSDEGTSPDFVYVALDAMRVADGDVTFDFDGGSTVTVTLDRSDSRAAIDSSGGVPYVIAYAAVPSLGAGAHIATVSLPNGAAFDINYTE